jgi:hypothetical protein
MATHEHTERGLIARLHERAQELVVGPISPCEFGDTAVK